MGDNMHNSAFFICCLCLLGFLAVSLPRFASPSDKVDNKIDFFITSQPVGGTFSYNSRINLIVDTNIQSDVSYNWQWSTNGEYWSDVGQSYSQQQIFTFYFYSNSFYRCVCTYGDYTVYSVPVFCGSSQGQQGGQQKFALPFGDYPIEYVKEEPTEEEKEAPTEEEKEAPTEEIKKEVEQDEKIEEG